MLVEEVLVVSKFDTSCFNGEYVTGDIDDDYLERLQQARNDSAKKKSDEK